MADQTLNAEGLNCPLPILRAKKALKGMGAGQVLEVRATDPGSVARWRTWGAPGTGSPASPRDHACVSSSTG